MYGIAREQQNEKLTKYDIFLTSLYVNTVLGEEGPEIPGRIPSPRLETTIEIGEVVKAAGIADFTDAGGGVHQHTGGVAQPDVYDVVHKRAGSVLLEKTAESAGSHPHQRSQILQTQRFRIMN